MDPLYVIPAAAALGSLTVVAAGGAAWLVWSNEDEAPVAPIRSALREEAPVNPVVQALQSFSAPDDEDQLEELAQAIIQAGYRGQHMVERLLAVRTLLTLGLPLLSMWAVGFRITLVSSFLTLLAAGVGYYLPLWIARSAQSSRQQRLSSAVPNVMDMLVSCLEAGLGIDAALQYAAREIRVASWELGEELEITNAEMAAGIPRMDALRRLDARTGVKELSSLVNVLGQAEKFGAGAAQAIRAQARLSRQRRTLDAERRAAEAAPKLTVAMILFVLPALFVVLLGPSLVKVMQSLSPGTTF